MELREIKDKAIGIITEVANSIAADNEQKALEHFWNLKFFLEKELADLPAEPPVELPDEKPNETGLGEQFEQPESKPDAGVVSEPEKSQNRNDSGVS